METTSIEQQAKLTVLSFGAGQDSTYILYKIIRDQQYRNQVVQGDLLVMMSDTGAEHRYTFKHVAFIKRLCRDNGIEFYFITAKQGYHPSTWPTLQSQFLRNSYIISIMMPRPCTDNLKIRPFYNFLNVYIANRYYQQDLPSSTRNKTWIKHFVKDHGKIRVILGIAAGEEKRIKECKRIQKQRQLDLFKKSRKQPVTWMDTCIEKSYPMITEKINRAMAQQYILSTPWPLPPPSCCRFCPFLSKPEILWMYRFTRKTFISGPGSSRPRSANAASLQETLA